MARGRRRAPVVPEVVLPPEEQHDESSAAEDVDDFFAERHRKLATDVGDEAGVEDDGSDLGVGVEAGVMDIAVSDSSDDGDDSGGDSDSDADADGGGRDAGDPDAQWGGRRRAWYGGDTHEYEIMEDDERKVALRDEEAEARRLQTKALSKLQREDFVDSSDEDGEDGEEGGGADGAGEAGGLSGVVTSAAVDAAPELPALLRDLCDSTAELSALEAVAEAASTGGASGWRMKRARLRYHVLSSYATNIAFYLALRTDPDAAAVDVRTHPVIREIARLRALRKASEGFGGEADAGGEELERGVAAEECAADVDVPPSMERVLTAAVGGADDRRETLKEKRKKKRGKRKRKNSGASDGASAVAVAAQDAAFMRNVVGDTTGGGVSGGGDGDDSASAAKRRKLNRIVGTLERERQSRDTRRAAPADLQTVRQEPAPPKAARYMASSGGGGGEGSAGGGGDEDGDEEFTGRMLARKEKKERRAARKAEAEVPHHYAYDDSIKDKSLRRRASAQVVNNRGLTRYRPRDKKTPRAKNREAFSKAVKKRRSVVRDPVEAKPSSYGGEASGINMRARKSSRLSDV